MPLKKVLINIYSQQTPIIIKVYSLCGRLIASRVINQYQTSFCLCYNKSEIVVVAEWQNIREIKRFYLTNCYCQVINVFFGFTTQNLEPMQNIILLDEFYNMPIKKATLNFLQKSPNAS